MRLTLILTFASASSALLIHAADVPQITFLPVNPSPASLPGSPVFGIISPWASQKTAVCAGNSLASAIRVRFDSSKVTGFSLICRSYAVIGATDTTFAVETPLVGVSGSEQALIECDSGRAISGVRLRSGLWIDALGISCATVRARPDLALVSYTNDPVWGTGHGMVVDNESISAQASPLGGSGGTAESFDCSNHNGFVQMILGAFTDKLEAVQARCGRPLTSRGKNGPEDLTVRTVGQLRTFSNTATDTFTVELYNLGAAGNPSSERYFDTIFLTDEAVVVALSAGCTSLGASTIRCFHTSPLATFDHSSFTFQMTPVRSLAEANMAVFQASYALADADYSNNTYAFAQTVH